MQIQSMDIGAMNVNDTICAISTPHGVGGIAVIRVSGTDALPVTQKIWKGRRLTDMKTHTAHFGHVTTESGAPLDQAVLTVFRGPGSYTGEDIVEISVHGSVYVQERLLQALCASGARLAEPGEYTRRAFAAAKIDLIQAESIADILSARTEAAHTLAMAQLRGGVSDTINNLRQKLIDLAALLELELDFSEEDVEFASRQSLIRTAEEVCRQVNSLHDSFRTGDAIKNGIPIAITGPTNAGKSSLLNALTGDDRAIVSDIHGTTRDIVEDTIIIGGTAFRLMDTAGLRETDDPIELLGIERSRNALNKAMIILDVQSPDTNVIPTGDTPIDTPVIHIHNKCDLLERLPVNTDSDIYISTKTGQGIDVLRQALKRMTDRMLDVADTTPISNLRHRETLAAAAKTAAEVLEALRADLPGVLVAQPLRETIRHLSTLTGAITDSTLLQTIFSRYCIGK